VVRIGGSQLAEEVWEGMKALVEGDVQNLGELDEGTGVDWGRVDKVRLYRFFRCYRPNNRCTKWQR
jgi:hypothetical protein